MGDHDDRRRSDRKRGRDDERDSRRSKSDAPILNTFKQWIEQCKDEMIQPDDAAKQYASYKIGERKNHIASFFVEHKEEEWFKEKYHPEESKNHKKIKEAFLRERFAAWKKLHEADMLKNVVFDLENDQKLAKALDAAIMVMENIALSDIEAFMNDGKSSNAEAKKSDDETKSDDPDQEDGEVMETKKPKAVKSLYIKSIPASMTKNELIQACKRYDGFERLAMETIPNDSKFKRRAWITYKDQVNIRDVSWNLNNIRLKDCELGTVAEKPLELKDRIRNVPGLSNHGPIAFRDLKMAISCCEKKDAHMAKIDESAKVAHKESAADESGDVPEEDEPVPEFWGENSNPVLNAAKKFVEQHNEIYEERIAEMLKKPEDKKAKIAKIENQDGEIKTEVAEDENDEDLIEIDCIDDIFGVLDPLLAYLRIVHYIDFYNQSDYHSFEDEHPYRVGACHVRGGIPSRGVSAETARDFTLKFEEKITTNLLKCDGLQLDGEQSAELGLKSIDDEIEAFLAINTQQLDAEKYLCPLSNKKFKGKEYVRKHIFNKHGDKVDAVRGDVNYFNNYVRDSNKDGPLEPRYVPKSNSSRSDRDVRDSRRGGEDSRRSRDDRGSYSRQDSRRTDVSTDRRGQGYQANSGGVMSRHSKDQLRAAANGRQQIDYNDLDAPNDMDMFG